MSQPRSLIRARGTFVNGLVMPLLVVCFGVLSAYVVVWVAEDFRSGDPFPVTGSRYGGPVAIASMIVSIPLLSILVVAAVIRLLKWTGCIALLYARSKNGVLVVGPLLRIATGRGLVVDDPDDFDLTLRPSRVREFGFWAFRWRVQVESAGFVIGAPRRVAAADVRHVRDRLREIQGL